MNPIMMVKLIKIILYADFSVLRLVFSPGLFVVVRKPCNCKVFLDVIFLSEGVPIFYLFLHFFGQLLGLICGCLQYSILLFPGKLVFLPGHRLHFIFLSLFSILLQHSRSAFFEAPFISL